MKLPIESSLEELLQQSSTSMSGSLVFKMVFEDSLKEEILTSLNNMNINHLTLFPDLIGSSLQTNYLFDIDSYLNKSREAMWDNYKKSIETQKQEN